MKTNYRIRDLSKERKNGMAMKEKQEREAGHQDSRWEKERAVVGALTGKDMGMAWVEKSSVRASRQELRVQHRRAGESQGQRWISESQPWNRVEVMGQDKPKGDTPCLEINDLCASACLISPTRCLTYFSLYPHNLLGGKITWQLSMQGLVSDFFHMSPGSTKHCLQLCDPGQITEPL